MQPQPWIFAVHREQEKINDTESVMTKDNKVQVEGHVKTAVKEKPILEERWDQGIKISVHKLEV